MMSVRDVGQKIVSKWLSGMLNSWRIILILQPDVKNTGSAVRNTGKIILKKPLPVVRNAGKDFKMESVHADQALQASEAQDLMTGVARMEMTANQRSRTLWQ